MIELLIVLLVGGNAYQYIENDHLKTEISELQEANQANANTIDNFSASLEECSDIVTRWRGKESEWQAQRESSRERLIELERIIDSSDWGQCRIPSDLEF